MTWPTASLANPDLFSGPEARGLHPHWLALPSAGSLAPLPCLASAASMGLLVLPWKPNQQGLVAGRIVDGRGHEYLDDPDPDSA
jgi:hypothetical protein